MLQNKKMRGGSILLAGLAAFAYYKYSKLTPEKKEDILGSIKEKGKSLYDQYIPGGLKNLFGKKDNSTSTSNDMLKE